MRRSSLVIILVVAVLGACAISYSLFQDRGFTAHRNNSGTLLITGGLGFIGSHVVDAALAKHLRVLVFDDESNGHNHNLLAKNYHGDISVVKDLEEIDESVDFIVHLAAAISVSESMTNPEKYTRVNVNGSQHVLDWAVKHHVKHVVAASSAAVYGNPDPILLPINEDVPIAPLSPYAQTKADMEVLMRDAWEKHQLSSTALRFFNVYGPRQDPKNPYSGVISIFMAAAHTNNPIRILGDGEQTRDFVFVKDVADFVLSNAMEPMHRGYDVFNVCTGHITTINELAKAVTELFGSKQEIQHGEPRNGDIRFSACTPQKATEHRGFSPRYTLRDGLAATREWFLAAQRDPLRR